MINTIKTYIIVSLVALGVWFFKSWQYRGEEMQRQSENISFIRKYDSLKYAYQNYNKKEIEEYLEYTRKDLKKYLDENNIRTNRLEKIITQSLKYRDTITRDTDLNEVLHAIRNNTKIKTPIIDSTDCLVVKGFVAFENDTLSLDITERIFKNKTDVVTYWERNQWKFLGIKTRIFGKKKATVKVKDNCGKSETFVIEKK